MSTDEKINNTIDEIKKVLARHIESDDAKKALVNLDLLLEKKKKDKKEDN